jgi:hypothetical protein
MFNFKAATVAILCLGTILVSFRSSAASPSSYTQFLKKIPACICQVQRRARYLFGDRNDAAGGFEEAHDPRGQRTNMW